ncbi:MAG: hypothetical protein MRY78_08335 [Saprospiraceae bacterium]|nr:hypothetical protein [Saprospiraceae bacterium]
MRLLIALFLCCCVAFACERTHLPAKPAFYYWQTNVQLDSTERAYVQALGADRLYVKYFDIDWNYNRQEAVPLASAKFDTLTLNGIQELVPTIFITNRTLREINSNKLPQLASQLFQRMLQIHPPHFKIHEIQIDCDWSGTTRDKYFELLRLLRPSLEKRQIRLSATIRLHQIKYADQTGIPPVDKGLLMFYNMGELENWEESNSILNVETAAQYVEQLHEYPLMLDLALPIYSWGVVFRSGKFIKLVNQLSPADLAGHPHIVKITSSRFILNKSTYLKGYYFYKGDQIRLEQCHWSDLQKAHQLLSDKLATPPQYVSFYHLDSAVVQSFTYDQLTDLCVF